MKTYIGVKEIRAKEMNRLDYNNFRGWELPEDEDGTDEGYLVEYIDGGEANTTEYEGYISWSPAAVFERAYKVAGTATECNAVLEQFKKPDECSTEAMIQAKGLTAPRLTPAMISATISKQEFHRLTGVLTVCVLTSKNGFTVTGESACASPENFDAEVGNKIAFENAREKIWALEGYLLKERLYNGQK